MREKFNEGKFNMQEIVRNSTMDIFIYKKKGEILIRMGRRDFGAFDSILADSTRFQPIPTNSI